MGWDALMFAELQFPAGGVSAWKKLTLDESTYSDDTDDQWIGTSGKDGTVAELLADIAEHQKYSEKTRGVDWLELAVSNDEVTFRAMINEDDFRYWQGIVGNVLRIAEKVSARGEYVVVANDDMVGARVVLDGKGGSRVEEFSLSELLGGEESPEEGALDYATIVEEMFAKMSAKLDSLTKKTAAKKKSTPAKKKATPAKKKATAKKAVPKKKGAKKKGAKKKGR